MPVVPMREILKDARIRGYAVGCYNAINLEMIRGILEAAEAEASPVILCHAEVHLKYTSLESIVPVMAAEAARAKVPAALLLDHGKDFGVMVRALHLGMNAVMFDGSSLPDSENIEKTREIVRIAQALDADVEAELGHVTRPKSAGADGSEDDSVIDDTSLYTSPDKAADFVAATGVQALAVAFGTAHGLYLKTPVLDLVRLAQIRDRVLSPLVMHGGSGLTETDFRQAIRAGICKVNYYTGMAVAAAERIRATLAGGGTAFYHNLMMMAIDSFRQDAVETMRIFGSSGKA